MQMSDLCYLPPFSRKKFQFFFLKIFREKNDPTRDLYYLIKALFFWIFYSRWFALSTFLQNYFYTLFSPPLTCAVIFGFFLQIKMFCKSESSSRSLQLRVKYWVQKSWKSPWKFIKIGQIQSKKTPKSCLKLSKFS